MGINPGYVTNKKCFLGIMHFICLIINVTKNLAIFYPFTFEYHKNIDA